MRFLRLVVMKFESSIDKWLINWKIDSEGVQLLLMDSHIEESNTHLLVAALTPVPKPEISDGALIVPTQARRKCEAEIEFAANVIAVHSRCRRSIKSVVPAAAFEAESEEEYQFLQSATNGIDLTPIVTGHYPHPHLGEIGVISQLGDRKEGLALLAEGINHSLASGKYREYLRLFENAFCLSPCPKLAKKLVQFLNPEMGYSRHEVNTWLTLRDGISHADKKRASQVVLESDV